MPVPADVQQVRFITWHKTLLAFRRLRLATFALLPHTHTTPHTPRMVAVISGFQNVAASDAPVLRALCRLPPPTGHLLMYVSKFITFYHIQNTPSVVDYRTSVTTTTAPLLHPSASLTHSSHHAISHLRHLNLH